ncbi:hypothetical protein RJ640_003226 [Escallonia rubra]|uniref:dUTP diphosphatase n=1 Tax=Escallonia rubra TaxID=112253 RepID=A0AA88QXY8_9ASTE|nr:hypothetical protein RJ640_003226 [Escallonia rubra]
MAPQEDPQTHRPETQEPTPKFQKLDRQNGLHQSSPDPPLFFLVKKLSEKAVLPSRTSSLSAGYDLSSATDTRVPAKGKALVPTNLSIAVPQGTYARVDPATKKLEVLGQLVNPEYRSGDQGIGGLEAIFGDSKGQVQQPRDWRSWGNLRFLGTKISSDPRK